MSLDPILLGLLREPASGYDLKAQFDHGIGYFWTAELSQIYPTLKRLEKAGLLRSEQAASARGAGRLVYETTDAGRQVLAEWLRSEPQVGDIRVAFLAQLFLMDELGDLNQTLKFLVQLRARLAPGLEALKTVEREWAACDPQYPDDLTDSDFHRYMTLRMGLSSIGARVRWCEESIRLVRARIQRAGAAKRNGSGSAGRSKKTTRTVAASPRR